MNTHSLVLAAGLALGAQAAHAVTVAFKAPSAGAVMSGAYQDTPLCEVTGNAIYRVEFFLGGAKLNTELNAPWNCSFNSTDFANGAYVLRAVAYDRKGRSATAQVNVTVQNVIPNVAPSVSFLAPAAGATVSGNLQGSACEATAADADGSIAKVDFYMGAALVGSRSAAPYQCAIDTTAYANGQYTLMAVATDNQGAAATTQRTVTFQNVSAPPTARTIDAADVLTQVSADMLFAQQSNYYAQVIGTFPYVTAISETGIHYTALANGETLRFGKVADPLDSTLAALAVQVQRDDPNTSGAKRVEVRGLNNIEMEKDYWAALSVYVYDWGTLASSDQALFGIQLHSGSTLDLSPAFSLYTTNSGRNFKVQALYSTSTSPSQSNTVKSNYADQPIPFGRWIDFVFKFRQSVAGSGYLKAWMDGNPIADHPGYLGFSTGATDYMKFGYYNWSGTAMSATARKVLLRSPTIVADPSGKYSADDLRAHLHAAP